MKDGCTQLDFMKYNIQEKLIKNGIDINDKNYRKHPLFEEISDIKIMGLDGGINTDLFIERYLLSEEQLRNSFISKYEMGYPEKLGEQECQFAALVKELIRCEIFPVDIDEKIFYRKGGYKDRLKKFFDFDIDVFSNKFDENIDNEIFKILFLISKIEYTDYNGRRVLEMLSKPSLENIDQSSVGRQTSNGNIIKLLKHNLEKELKPEFLKKVKEEETLVAYGWGEIIKDLICQIWVSDIYGNFFDIEETIDLLKKITTSIDISKNKKNYKYSPIETMYLKILQYENRGREKDIQFVNLQELNISETAPKWIMRYKRMLDIEIKLEDVESCIINNINEYTQLVYQKDEVNKKEVNKVRNSIDKLKKVLSFFEEQTKLFIETNRKIYGTLIISCLQEIILGKQNEKLDYVFHGMSNFTTSKPSISGTLKGKKNTLDVLKIVWIKRVMIRFNANIGKQKLSLKILEIENLCDNILDKILGIPNLDDMIMLNNYYISQIGDKTVYVRDQIEGREKLINNIYRKKGYKLVDDNYLLCCGFAHNKNISQCVEEMEKYICDEIIPNKTEKFELDLEAVTEENQVHYTVHFDLCTDIKNKVIKVLSYKKVYEEAYCQEIIELGGVIV